VLLVSVDSLRADHLHCYGYPRQTSPVIDSLAREGVRFRTVLSPTSWTLPAHLTLLTALPPESHGVVDDGMQLRPEAVTLAEVLWQAGYATAGVVSGPYLDSEYGFSQGFEHYDDYSVVKVLFKFLHRGSTSPRLVEVAGDWLQDWSAHGRDRPFFLFLHMWDVHYDYEPPPPFDSSFDPGYRGRVTGRDVQTGPAIHAGMDPRDLQHVIALYDGEIAFTDQNIGRLVAMLKSMGAFDDTLVVVTADHGEEFLEHGGKTHHQSLYDESLLVPLVIRFPGGSRTATVTRQVRLMDVAPTILGTLGVAPPGFGGTEDPFCGRDLTPLIDDDHDDPGSPGSSLPAFGHLRNKSELQVSIRTGQFKYIRREQGGSWRDELYDLLADPGERANLAGRRPPLEGELRRDLLGWREHWGRGTGLSRDMRLNGQQTEELKALGYIR
jgi:arylsulfatase A-like enzyme